MTITGLFGLIISSHPFTCTQMKAGGGVGDVNQRPRLITAGSRRAASFLCSFSIRLGPASHFPKYNANPKLILSLCRRNKRLSLSYVNDYKLSESSNFQQKMYLLNLSLHV